MNRQQAIVKFMNHGHITVRARYQWEFDSLLAATAAHQKLVLEYPGPYYFRGEITPLDNGKFLVLGTWNDLGD